MKAPDILNEIDQNVEDIRSALQGLYDIVELACENGIVSDHDFSTIYKELEDIEQLIDSHTVIW
jgi:hypothetical protein